MRPACLVGGRRASTCTSTSASVSAAVLFILLVSLILVKAGCVVHLRVACCMAGMYAVEANTSNAPCTIPPLDSLGKVMTDNGDIGKREGNTRWISAQCLRF